MAELHTISAEIRADAGKRASRRLRRNGQIPAVLYGADRDPVSLTLDHMSVLHAAEHESFYSSILEIQVGDGRSQRVVVRDMQRHPYKQQIMHLDFMRVSESEVLRISVPLHFVGEDKSAAGKTSGVVIQHLVTELEIAALPKDLPEYLDVDLSELDAGDSVMLSDIRLPEGVEIVAQTAAGVTDSMVAKAIHISETQGTGAAAAAEAEALAAEEGELAVEGVEEEVEAAEEGAETEADTDADEVERED
jgi:large subunit ribosomal protein L25